MNLACRLIGHRWAETPGWMFPSPHRCLRCGVVR